MKLRDLINYAGKFDPEQEVVYKTSDGRLVKVTMLWSENLLKDPNSKFIISTKESAQWKRITRL